jgi:hypothetical protein
MPKNIKPITADEIAEKALAGESVVEHFEPEATFVRVARRVNVEFAPAMLDELDSAAEAINVPR